MTQELKKALQEVAEEDCKRERATLEEDFERYKLLLIKIAELRKFDLLTKFEGTSQNEKNTDEIYLNTLEHAKLVKSQMKFTHRNAYREYELTEKGSEIVQKLASEK